MSGARQSNAFVVCSLVVGAAAGLGGAWAAVRRWRRGGRARAPRRASPLSPLHAVPPAARALCPKRPAPERAPPLGASASASATE